MAETSADQYAPIRDTKRYMDSKGGAGTYKPGRERHDEQTMTEEERRHADEVGHEEHRQRRAKGEGEPSGE